MEPELSFTFLLLALALVRVLHAANSDNVYELIHVIWVNRPVGDAGELPPILFSGNTVSSAFKFIATCGSRD